MRSVSGPFHDTRQLGSTRLKLTADAWHILVLCLRPAPVLAAERLFLRKPLALYEDRQVKPRRAPIPTRLAMVWRSCWFDWRTALRIVKPETFTRRHGQGFRWFWRCQSQPGRPALPKGLQALIRRMALEHPTWGQERIDRDSVFSKELDQGVRRMGVRVLKTPVRTPVAHARCERVIGAFRRDCLDFVIPLNARHLSVIGKEWVAPYNEGRPHMSLGPGIPQPRLGLPASRAASRHSIPTGHRTVARPILRGLPHECSLEQIAA